MSSYEKICNSSQPRSPEEARSAVSKDERDNGSRYPSRQRAKLASSGRTAYPTELSLYMLQKYLISLSAALFSFYNLFLLSFMNVSAPYLMRNLHLNAASFGVLTSYNLWGNMLGLLPIGLLLDKCAVKIIGLTLLGLTIVATFVMTQTQSLTIMSLMRFIQGVSSAGSLLITTRIGTTLSHKHAQTILGVMIAIALSGGVAGNYVFAHWMLHFGWHHALQFTVYLGLTCFIVMLLFLSVPPNAQFSVRAITTSIHRKNIYAGIIIGLLSAPIFILGTAWGNEYLIQQQHLTLLHAAFTSALFFLGIIIGSPCWGIIADRWLGFWPTLFIGCIALSVLSLFLGLPEILNIRLIDILFFGIGFFCCVQNLLYVYIEQHNSHMQTSTAIAIAALIANLLGAGMQTGFGILIMSLPKLNISAITVLPVLSGLSLIILVGLRYQAAKKAI